MYSINGKREHLFMLYNIIPFINADKGKHMAISQVMKNIKRSMQDYFDEKEEIESLSRREKFAIEGEITELENIISSEDDLKKKEEHNKEKTNLNKKIDIIDSRLRHKIQELKNKLEDNKEVVEIKMENEAFIYIKDMLETQASDLFNSPIYLQNENKSIKRLEYTVFENVMELFTSAVRG